MVELPGHCYACGAACETRMFTTAIPHFKEVVIMSNSCGVCGYRDSEVKPGGGFSDKGRTITLQATLPHTAFLLSTCYLLVGPLRSGSLPIRGISISLPIDCLLFAADKSKVLFFSEYRPFANPQCVSSACLNAQL